MSVCITRVRSHARCAQHGILLGNVCLTRELATAISNEVPWWVRHTELDEWVEAECTRAKNVRQFTKPALAEVMW
jgi:hypothetical protein